MGAQGGTARGLRAGSRAQQGLGMSRWCLERERGSWGGRRERGEPGGGGSGGSTGKSTLLVVLLGSGEKGGVGGQGEWLRVRRRQRGDPALPHVPLVGCSRKGTARGRHLRDLSCPSCPSSHSPHTGQCLGHLGDSGCRGMRDAEGCRRQPQKARSTQILNPAKENLTALRFSLTCSGPSSLGCLCAIYLCSRGDLGGGSWGLQDRSQSHPCSLG